MERSYIAIDLKSFYASVECVERELDPLTAKLVVADESRSDNTICLAVSPALKTCGLPGRCRLFEVRQKAAEIEKRTGEPLEYIVALPRMQLYMDYSKKIYGIYLKYISKEDIHIYSIDEVFMDVTDYLHLYRNPDGTAMTPHDLAMTIIRDVLKETGITATAGIGTNLYLAKIAMDIVAKHVPADKDGVRIADLNERKYREELWSHTPLRSFWRVGAGISKKLEANGMFTMGDIARMSLRKCYYDETSDRPDYVPPMNAISGEDFLYKLFGIDAEILIDHAWGIEPVRMSDIKNYKPETNSISSGQVLGHAYSNEKARLLVKEMADSMALELFGKHLVTDRVALVVNYDKTVPKSYKGEMHKDYYGRIVPKAAAGNEKLPSHTSSSNEIMEAAVRLFDRITNKELQVRRLSLTMCNTLDEETARRNTYHQLSLFDFMTAPNTSEEAQNKKTQNKRTQEKELSEKERRLQEAMLKIKGKYGDNALLRGMNFEEGATMRERNGQIGGHRK